MLPASQEVAANNLARGVYEGSISMSQGGESI